MSVSPLLLCLMIWILGVPPFKLWMFPLSQEGEEAAYHAACHFPEARRFPKKTIMAGLQIMAWVLSFSWPAYMAFFIPLRAFLLVYRLLNRKRK